MPVYLGYVIVKLSLNILNLIKRTPINVVHKEILNVNLKMSNELMLALPYVV